MRKPSSICVLVSGGLDSDVLLAETARNYRRVWPVYIRQGLAWEDTEIYWLKKYILRLTWPHPTFRRPLPRGEGWGEAKFKILQPLRILELPTADLYGAHWSTGQGRIPGARTPDQAVYLPGRNLVLSVKAAVFAAIKKIPVLALGSLDHNPFSDASPRFFKVWGKALGTGLGVRLKVMAPYRKFSKVDVIRRGKHLPLDLSFSCIAPKGRFHCGRCNKCAERRHAFREARVKDKTRYAKN